MVIICVCLWSGKFILFNVWKSTYSLRLMADCLWNMLICVLLIFGSMVHKHFWPRATHIFSKPSEATQLWRLRSSHSFINTLKNDYKITSFKCKFLKKLHSVKVSVTDDVAFQLYQHRNVRIDACCWRNCFQMIIGQLIDIFDMINFPVDFCGPLGVSPWAGFVHHWTEGSATDSRLMLGDFLENWPVKQTLKIAVVVFVFCCLKLFLKPLHSELVDCL